MSTLTHLQRLEAERIHILREVVADPVTVDPRFLVDHARLDRIAAVIEAHWPEEIAADGLRDPTLVAAVEAARRALLDALGLAELA